MFKRLTSIILGFIVLALSVLIIILGVKMGRKEARWHEGMTQHYEETTEILETLKTR